MAIIESIAMFFIKSYTIDNNTFFILIGGALYFLIAIIFSFILKQTYIVNANIYWNILSTVFSLFVGFLFGEYLSINNVVGILFCFAGIYIINM